MKKSENKLSPMMEHYKAIKAQYPEDTIVMYRLGDFYEMFFDDAIVASKILDLTLTGRDCGLEERAPMCGVPHHAVDGYISKLVKNGKRVAICEQLSLPGDQKGMVKRDVVRVITPGTITDDETLDGGSNNYLASIYAGEKCASLAWVDISTGETKVLELNDADVLKLEDLILSIAPNEIIANTKAYELAYDFESVKVGNLPKPRQHYDYAFDTENATKTLLEFFNSHNLTALGLENSYSGLSALGGLFSYVEITQKRTLNNILPPKFVRLNSQMFIDYNTKKNLELTEVMFEHSKVGSLLWVLDQTRTNMGARALKRTILEPMLKDSDINMRLDSVENLYKNLNVRAELGAILANIRDVERLSNKIAYNTINPRECLAIAYSLKQLPSIKSVLKGVSAKKLVEIRETINPLEGLQELIEKAIVDTPPVSLKDGGVIKPGYSNELDNYRNAQFSAKKWLAEYEAKEREETGLKTLKVGYNRVFGYYIEVSNSYLSQVPYRFERKQTLTTGERFITQELKEMEAVILGAEEKAHALEERLYAEIKSALHDAIKILQENARAIGELDVIYSFAQVAVNNNYVRPKISDKITHINIKDGRHPVVEALKKSNEFVPNDTVLNNNDSRTLIITGPNMAGKSTYMRQVALIVLMAHMGSFVPASHAEICTVDRVFTRVGASDNLAYGQSTFMVEMSEVANILNNATPRSLLVLDEIGRGTSTLDGLSIAWAIVEYISLKLGAKTLFATHYHELSELEKAIPGLKNYHVLIKDTGGTITFLYKLGRGGANKSFGIEVAQLAGVNKKVIERAKLVMTSIEEAKVGDINLNISANPSNEAIPTSQMGFFVEDDKYSEISKILNDINVDECTPIQALTILSNLQKLVKPNKKGKK